MCKENPDLKDLKKLEGDMKNHYQPCPHCGYCPTCGRPYGNYNYPYYPPMYPQVWC